MGNSEYYNMEVFLIAVSLSVIITTIFLVRCAWKRWCRGACCKPKKHNSLSIIAASSERRVYAPGQTQSLLSHQPVVGSPVYIDICSTDGPTQNGDLAVYNESSCCTSKSCTAPTSLDSPPSYQELFPPETLSPLIEESEESDS